MNLLNGRPLSTFSSIAFLVLLSISNSYSQGLDLVELSGTVADSNGSVVTGASVTAVLGSTGARRRVITNSTGRYRFVQLRPGTYTVNVTADGFASKARTGVHTISGQSVRLDFVLLPAGVIAKKTVIIDEADAPIVDTSRVVVGSTITEEELVDIPNASTDVLDLVYAVAGTSEEPFSIRNLASDDRIGGGSERDEPSEVLGAGNVSLSGNAAYSTNITIDGLDNNDDRAAGERFQPPIDSIAEIQVISNQFSAEYGRASGGRINIRTKAGSRKFRGRAFLSFEDDGLNANTYNNNRRSLSRLPFTDWKPGFNLGGPVPFYYFKNKTYFYTSYSLKHRSARTQIYSALPVDQNPVYPLPVPTDPTDSRIDDDPGKNGGFPAVNIATYAARINTPSRRSRFTQRFDHNFSDTHNLTFSYQRGRAKNFRQYRETTRFLEETLQGRTRNNDSFYLTDNLVISAAAVNQFRFQYSSYRPDFAAKGSHDPVVLLFISDDSRSGSPDRVRGTVVVGNSTANFASFRKETRFQIQETLNYSAEDMNWRFGFDVQKIASENVDLRDATGTFNFSRVADFLSNQPSRFRRNFGASSIQHNTYVGTFLQNDWRIAPGIMLAFGLRYERESLVNDRNNFAPRLGVAFSPGDDGKSVLRFGAGVFYNRTLLRTLDDYALGVQSTRFDSELLNGPGSESRCLNGPTPADASTDKCRFLARLAAYWPTPPTETDLRGLLSDLNIANGGFRTDENFTRFVDKDIKIPESYQLNFGYEREIGSGFAFETNLTWNKSVRLWRETNVNSFRPPPGFATLTDYLVQVGTIEVGGTMTMFEVGDPADPLGVRLENGVRIVNLATLNSSEARSAPIGIAFAALESDPNMRRPYNPGLEQVEKVGSVGRSNYIGLSFELNRRLRPIGNGFSSSLRLNYLLSRNRDDGFVDTSSAQTAGDFEKEFARSGIDRRHKIRLTGAIQTPFWLGGIKLAPLLRLESGRPFNVSIGGRDRNLDDVGNDRPNFTGDTRDIVWRHPNDPFSRTLVDRFTLPPIGTAGNLPRNAGIGPALVIFDLGASRRFELGRRIRLKPQITINNVLNATVFSFGSDFINLQNASTPEFAQGFFVPSRTLRQRTIQLGLRFEF